MTARARVAVVIPTYASNGLLRRAVTSVLEQSLSEWELVVVDDGSPEDLGWVSTIDPRVRLLRQRNRGVSVARNVGVAATTAEHVAFLDQDDEWSPQKLATQLSDLVDRRASFAHTGFSWVSAHGEQQAADGAPLSYERLLLDQYVCLSTVMVARSLFQAVGGFDPLLRIQQDYDFDLKAALLREPTAFTPGVLTRYHVHDANTSSDYWLMWQEAVRVLGDHQRRAERDDEQDVVRALRRVRQRTRRLAGAQALQAYRHDSQPTHLVRAIWGDPHGTARGVGQSLRRRTALRG